MVWHGLLSRAMSSSKVSSNNQRQQQRPSSSGLTSSEPVTTFAIEEQRGNSSTSRVPSQRLWRRQQQPYSKSLPTTPQRRISWIERAKHSKSFSSVFFRNNSSNDGKTPEGTEQASNNNVLARIVSQRRSSRRRRGSGLMLAPPTATLAEEYTPECLLPEDDQTIEFVPATTAPKKQDPSSIQEEGTPQHRLSERDIYDFVWEYMESFTKVAQEHSHGKFAGGDDEEEEEKKKSQEDDDAWNLFWQTFHTPDYLLIRPSGNSLDVGGYRKLFESGQITNFSEQVVAVESIKLLGSQIACVVFKTEQSFHLREQRMEDFLTWSAVIVQDATTGQLQITNIHRSAGRSIMAPCISSDQ